MGIGNAILDVMSLGAHRRVRKYADRYEQIRFETEFTYELVDKGRSGTMRALQELAETRAAAAKTLYRMRKLLGPLGAPKAIPPDDDQLPDRKTSAAAAEPEPSEAPKPLSAGRVLINTAKGAGVGVSTGAGTLVIASSLTATSTTVTAGAASGAAASAALLTLGGGPTALGGFGVVGGAAVLGGVTLIPAMAVTGYLGHKTARKKIEDFQEAVRRAGEELCRYRALGAKLDNIERHARELRTKIIEDKKELDQSRRTVTKALFPLGLLSRQYRTIKTWFGGQYYNEEELKVIAPVLDMASNLAEMINTPVLSEEDKSKLAAELSGQTAAG